MSALEIPKGWAARHVDDEVPPGVEVQCPRCLEWIRCDDEWFLVRESDGVRYPRAPCKACQAEYSAANYQRRRQRREREREAAA